MREYIKGAKAPFSLCFVLPILYSNAVLALSFALNTHICFSLNWSKSTTLNFAVLKRVYSFMRYALKNATVRRCFLKTQLLGVAFFSNICSLKMILS